FPSCGVDVPRIQRKDASLWPMKLSIRLLCLLCLLGLTASLAADEPVYEWVFAGGGEKNDKTRGITVDDAGQVYLTGETIGEGRFGSLTRPTQGETDCFL